MIAGVAPYKGSPADVITAHLRDPVPLLPAELNLPELNLVLKMSMAKEPTDRFESAQAFKSALREAEQAFIGRHLRIDTQILTPGSTENKKVAAPIEKEKHFESTNSVPVLKPESAFNSAITEPHEMDKLAKFFTPIEEHVDSKGSKLNWRLLFALFFLFALLFALRPLVESTEPETPQSRTLEESIVEKTGERSTIKTPFDAPWSENSTQKVTVGLSPQPDVSPISASGKSFVKQPAAKPPKQQKTVQKKPRKKKKISVRKKRRPRTTKKQQPKRSVPTVNETSESDQSTTPKPVKTIRKPTVLELANTIKLQIDSCDCDGSKINISRLAMRSAERAQALESRWAEACGVMGEGCRR